MKKKIQKTLNVMAGLLAVAVLLPALTSAATFTLSPSLGNYKKDDVITTSLYVNPGAGETITAIKISLSFPADKLEVSSYTPTTGGSILAHVGTSHDNTVGTIVDNVAFNPGITAPTKVATIVFKAKTDGVAPVSVSSDAKALDSASADKLASKSAIATFTVETQQETQPEVQPQTQPQTPPATQNKPKQATQPKAQLESEGDTQATTSTTTEETATTSTTTESTTTDEAQDQTASPAGLLNNKWALMFAIIAILLLVLFVAKRRKEN